VYSATRDFEEHDVPASVLLDVVYDVEDYPAFVKGIRAVTLQNQAENTKLAEFRAGVGGMKFSYILFVERLETEVRWRQLSGTFRSSEGFLLDLGGGNFRYHHALDPGFAVPGFGVRFVLERSLPRLIKQFRKRALERTHQDVASE
jgi:hypothetical protein